MTFQERPNNWEPPDGLGYSSLRPVQLSRHGIALTVLGVVFLIGAPVLGMLVFQQSNKAGNKRSLLRQEGVATTAVITRLWGTGGKDNRHMVQYRFAAENRDVEGKAQAPFRIWKGFVTGAGIPIRFVPAQPEVNHPSEWELSQVPMWVALLPGGILLLPSVVFFILIRKQMRLLSEGRPAPGTVTRIKRTDKAVIVYYDFTLLSGAVMKGRSGGGRWRPALGVGSPVCVLYDPENPRRNAIYPMPLVKLMRS